jgi:hypothetical protein
MFWTTEGRMDQLDNPWGTGHPSSHSPAARPGGLHAAITLRCLCLLPQLSASWLLRSPPPPPAAPASAPAQAGQSAGSAICAHAPQNICVIRCGWWQPSATTGQNLNNFFRDAALWKHCQHHSCAQQLVPTPRTGNTRQDHVTPVCAAAWPRCALAPAQRLALPTHATPGLCSANTVKR